MEAIREYEMPLSRDLVGVLSKSGAGASAPEKTDQRVPTFCFNLAGIAPDRVVESLAEQGIGARDGHMYSPRLMRRLGLKEEGGAVRVSVVHYNTIAEIERFARVLEKNVGSWPSRPSRFSSARRGNGPDVQRL
jgi:selenocysteine lyase/cysteine desulfurase